MSLTIPNHSLGTIINTDLDIYNGDDLINGNGDLFIRDGGIYVNGISDLNQTSINTTNGLLNINGQNKVYINITGVKKVHFLYVQNYI